MGKIDNSLMIDNVVQDGIRCCAKKCPASKRGTTEKFFFSFPECDLTDEDSIMRCRIWVRRAGNIEVIKHKLKDLHGKFFLCCSHFPDWTAKDSDHRCIPHDAIPAYFDCFPLAKSLMHAYAKIAFGDQNESGEENDLLSPSRDESENINLHLPPATPEANVGADTIIKEDPDNGDAGAASLSGSSESQQPLTTDSAIGGNTLPSDAPVDKNPVSSETEDVSTHPSIDGEDSIHSGNKENPQHKASETSETKEVPNDLSVDEINIQSNGLVEKESVEVTKNQRMSLTKKVEKPRLNIERRSTPTRKAKLDAVYKIFNQPNLDKEIEEDEPEMKIPRLSVSRPESERLQKLTWNPCAKGSNSMQDVSNQESMLPGSSSFTPSHNQHFTKSMPTGITEPERTQAKSIIVSNDIVSKLSKPYEKVRKSVSNGGLSTYVPSCISKSPTNVVTSPPHKSSGLKRNVTSLEYVRVLNAESGQFEFVPKGTVKCVTSESQNITSDCNNVSTIEPVSRSVGVQTEGPNGLKKREMIKILDSDRKLSIFSGLPSFAVLDSLADAILKMVMNNPAMITNIEPIMREWIVLTCTKFVLGLSLEALSIMFEVPEQECKKIVEKTCLFMRKTLSLPDCQKFVWMLPNVVLTGIADCSDEFMMVKN